MYGEYLVDAREDVVAGIRTPSDISTMADALPDAYEELVKNTQILNPITRTCKTLNSAVQDGKLFCAPNALKENERRRHEIAVDFVEDGTVTEKEAVHMVEQDTSTFTSV